MCAHWCVAAQYRDVDCDPPPPTARTHARARTRGQVTLGTRGLLLGILLALSSMGLVLALRGMVQAGSFMGTVLATASNLVGTALFGAIVFQEPLSLYWWAGASMIASGVVLMNTTPQTPQPPAARPAASAVAPPPAPASPTSGAGSGSASPTVAASPEAGGSKVAPRRRQVDGVPK